MRSLTAFITIAWLLCLSASEAYAAPPPVDQPALSREQTEHLLTVLKDPVQRERFVTTLEEFNRAASIKPVAGAVPAKAPSSNNVIAGTVRVISDGARSLISHVGGGFRALTEWSSLMAWVDALLSNPATRLTAWQAATRLALIGLLTLTIELLFRSIYARKPSVLGGSAAKQLPVAERLKVAGRRFFRSLTVAVAAGLVGNAAIFVALCNYPVGRSIAVGMLNAYLVVRLFMGLVDAALSPMIPAVRLLPMTDAGAKHAARFLRLLAVTVAFGFIAGEIVSELGASAEVHESVQKLVALIVHLLLIVMVIRSRIVVAGWIRRRLGTTGPLGMVGDALATAWPIVAVAGIASWWLVWAMDVPDGYQRILRFILATAGVLIAGQFLGSFLVSLIDRGLSPPANEPVAGLSARFFGYRGLIRSVTQVALMGVTLLVLMQAWGIDTLSWFDSGHVGNRVGLLALKLALLAAIGIICWEVADAAVEARVSRLMAESALARATRLRTLQPIVRIALVIVLSLVVVLTALSEIGINVGPLLAGASIFGVALGFGSQKLVQDFITGIFLLVEDAMDVGDAVTVAGVSGTVEHLSIRTIRLRAGDGSVHLIPFSAVTSVNNSNRGIGNAAVTVTVDAAEDTDRIGVLLEQIVGHMRTDPAFCASIQSDLQLWGVDKVEGGVVTIVGQIVCTDAGRWPVQREFNRRLKKLFEQEHIAMGVPHQSLRIEPPTERPDSERISSQCPIKQSTP